MQSVHMSKYKPSVLKSKSSHKSSKVGLESESGFSPRLLDLKGYKPSERGNGNISAISFANYSMSNTVKLYSLMPIKRHLPSNCVRDIQGTNRVIKQSFLSSIHF